MDSWALALLAHAYATQHNIKFIALTVNHNLRAESLVEAENVAAQCAARGIPHHILHWQHAGVSTGIQAAARAARYELLQDYCHTHGFSHLLTAHHANDQAETLAMRLLRGAGGQSLGGIQPQSVQAGITILRPLLTYTKQQLADYVATTGLVPAHDPSNENEKFERVRVRALNLPAAPFVELAAEVQALNTAQHILLQTLLPEDALYQNFGIYCVPHAMWQGLAELQQAAFIAIWRGVTGSTGFAPRQAELARALESINHPSPHNYIPPHPTLSPRRGIIKFTLGGMVVEVKKTAIIFYRELAACASPITIQPASTKIWDLRFEITNTGAVPITVGAAGMGLVRRLKPAAAAAALPALYEQNQPVLPLLPAPKTAAAALFSAKFILNITNRGISV